MMRVLFLTVLAAILAAPAAAHDPGLSSFAVRHNGSRLDALMTFAPADLAALTRADPNEDGSFSDPELEQVLPRIEQIADGAAVLELSDRRIVPTFVSVARVALPGNDNIQLKLSFPIEATGAFNVRSAWLERLPYGHRQYATVRDTEGALLVREMLDKSEPAFEIEISTAPQAGSAMQTFRSFLVLGVEHIAGGYDHLLFLLALLIVGSGVRAAAGIITSFTVAHSVTLALAAFGWVRLPAEVVEPLIAASIVYVGVENLWRGHGRHRWLLTFGFGLIHGLGFASVLEELLTAGDQILLPLLSFNLGVELGQLAIAALVLPLVWTWQRRSTFTARYAQACSLCIALAGAYWLVDRTIL